ncbi:tetratricopeptide repeat protein [Flagellimonas taeanensis]|uniref:tetratricopeptide repeat protein n=1 Tax=Flavobacteriaceae TaxID=49546 RepID=UPI000E6783A1|nr:MULTISPECIES: tetratricopeptide repeat protein [Allomuricauda]MDC6384897.1 tetratricopeptide repeat protein [Muricauda sp. SK9]RIV49121.1 tetratricopeptide repeat protein [Allomuricauda taeanensis]
MSIRYLFLSLAFICATLSYSQTNDEKDFHDLDIARAVLDKGNFEIGLKIIDSLLKVNPKNAYAWQMKGGVYANHYKDYKRAIEFYRKHEEIYPDNALNLANIGKNLFKIDSVIQGKRYISRAYQLEPINEYIISQYAYYISENVEDKIKLYKDAILISKLKQDLGHTLHESTQGEIYNNLGYNLYLHQDFLESTIYLLDGLEFGTNDPDHLNNLGNSLQRLNYHNSALNYYEKALEIDPNKVFSLNGKANTYLKMNQIDSACVYWKKALDNGYIFKEEWKNIWDIEDPKILIERYCEE